ncbi:MAG TPA: MlaD family protein [Ideonella sp.]|nr:MlaD family protein [Ideonella sp.]
METDKRYFIEGLFIIGLGLAAAFFAVWLSGAGERDDVLYRIRFAESVAGLAHGDLVKYRGVDAGTVKRIAIDPRDPRLVVVDVALHKDTPVRTDTRAQLKLKGITGAVYVELTGASPETTSLVASTPAGQLPEIPSEKSSLTIALEELPKAIEKLNAIQGKLPEVIEKFSSLENKASRVIGDVGEVTKKVKENPSLLLRPPKDKDKNKDKAANDKPPAS